MIYEIKKDFIDDSTGYYYTKGQLISLSEADALILLQLGKIQSIRPNHFNYETKPQTNFQIK